MNIKIQFEQAGHHFDMALAEGAENSLAPALMVAHLWNMDRWIHKASRALELYTRDRARNRERHIGNRCVFETSDEVAYLRIKIDTLKDRAASLMDMDEDFLEEAIEVIEEYNGLQSFLQPILWTDMPKSQLEITQS